MTLPWGLSRKYRVALNPVVTCENSEESDEVKVLSNLVKRITLVTVRNLGEQWEARYDAAANSS